MRLRDQVKSERTLTAYLKHLTVTGAITRVVDNATNKVIYRRMDDDVVEGFTRVMEGTETLHKLGFTVSAGYSRPEGFSLLRMRRRGFDIEDFYWGGQELGAEGWWEQVKRRAKSAEAAEDQAVNLWFARTYGRFAAEGAERMLSQIILQVVLVYIEIAALYLGMSHGTESLIIPDPVGSDPRKLKEWRKGRTPLAVSAWYRVDPKTLVWETISDNLALVALAIKSGSFKGKDAEKALMRIYDRCHKSLRPMTKLFPGTKHESLLLMRHVEIQGLMRDLRDESDPKRRAKAQEILRLQQRDK